MCAPSAPNSVLASVRSRREGSPAYLWSTVVVLVSPVGPTFVVRREKRPGPAHDDQNTMDSTMPRAPTPMRIQPMVWRSRAPFVGSTLTAKASTAPTATKRMPTPSPMIDTSYARDLLRTASHDSLRVFPTGVCTLADRHGPADRGASTCS